MFCFKCGAKVEEGSIFCDKCGALMDDGPSPVRNEAGKISVDSEIEMPSARKPIVEDVSLNESNGNPEDVKAWAIPSSVSFCEIEKPADRGLTNAPDTEHALSQDLSDNNAKSIQADLSSYMENSSSVLEGSKSSKRTKNQNKCFPIIVAVLIVVVLAIAVFFVVSTMSGSDKQPDTTVTEVGEPTNTASNSDKASEVDIEDKQTKDSPPFVGFKSVNATSELPTGGINTSSYVAANLIDGSASSCWCEGASGNGIGEFVTFSSPATQTVKGFTVWNGYQESDYLYYINARPRTVTIYADGDYIDSFNLKDSGLGSQSIVFDEPVITKTIIIEIADVYPGSKYEDCCISEIDFY